MMDSDTRLSSPGRYRPRRLAGLAVLTACLVGPSAVQAAPEITWTPSAVEDELRPGVSKTLEVTFTASVDLPQVIVRAVPELTGYVRAVPSSYLNVAAGESRSISLVLTAPAEALPEVVIGTVQVRNGLGDNASNISKPLPVTLTILEPANPGGLPPDPGEAGKATLEGIDSDSDGVRDDIQRYIALTYPDSAKTRAALTQLAKVNQQAILNADNKALSLDNGSAQDRAIECLWYLLDNGAIAVSHGLRAIILNTVERNRAYLTYNDQLAGEIFPSVPLSQEKFSCEFDPDALPN